MKRLFVTDLDGTLLNNESRVSERSARIISNLSRQGAMITVATARTPATVEPLLHKTLTTPPAIVLTGASMWDRERQRFLNPTLLPEKMNERLLQLFESHGVNPFIYTLPEGDVMTVFHTEELTHKERKFYEERQALKLKKFEFVPRPGEEARRVALFLGIGPVEEILRLGEAVRAEGSYSVSAYPDIFNPATGYIEVFHAGVSKAEAIMKLKEMTWAGHVTVYGDNLNDLPMFAVADEAVAVENALPEVKQAATRVIGAHTSDAVAIDMLQQFEG